MFKIRAEQMAEFDKARIPGFADYVVHHLKSFSPPHAKTMGEQGVREFAQSGLERANEYGFTRTGSVGLFVEMLILLGVKFDTDLQYPWAAEILNDNTIKDELARADLLWEKLMLFLKATRGTNQTMVKRAIQNAKFFKFDRITSQINDYRPALTKALSSVYPEKYEYLNGKTVERIIDHAIVQSEAMEVGTTKGICLFAILHFAMGKGFAEDPKFPWIAQTLMEKSNGPEKRIEILNRKFKAYLDDVLVNLNSGATNVR